MRAMKSENELFLPGYQPCGKGLILLGGPLSGSFLVMHNSKPLGEMNQFIGLETKLRPTRMVVNPMIIKEKGFINQHPPLFKGSEEGRKEGPV